MDNSSEKDLRVMQLVSMALRQQSSGRGDCLRRECKGDTELYREALAMLKAEEKMGSFLLQPLISPAKSPRPFEAGQVIAGRFAIIREIGEGGMGVVYEAFDQKRNLRLAIKAAKPGFQRLLGPELEGALIVRHTNVCRVNEIHTAHTDRGEVDFLTMELLEGETLSERLRASGKLVEVEALRIARQLCAGLTEAHRSGLIHRDLKTANVFLCRDHHGALRVVITDFGLASDTMRTDEMAGTPAYMAPELWKGESASKASDIYALGMILYQMVANPASDVSEGLPAPQHLTDLSERWNRTIQRCLDPSPSGRPESPSEVIVGLEEGDWDFLE